MTQPSRYPPPRDVAERILAIVAAQLQQVFAAALARHTSTSYDLGITEDETTAVAALLPAAASGHAAGELDAIAGGVLARYRADASAARTYQDTVAAFGPRAQPAVAPGPAGAGADPQRPQAPPAVSLGAATGGTSTLSGGCDEPCAVAGVELGVAEVGDLGDLSSDDAVLAAGVLANVYLLGDWTGFFRAVDIAVEQLDQDLYVEHRPTLNRMSCWTELHHRITAAERAGLAARVLGITDPLLPAGVEVDPHIQELLNRMLDAINANCDPRGYRDEPSPADRGALQWATEAVRARFTTSVSTYSILRIKQLQVQFGQAQRILSGLAPYVRSRCRPHPRWAQPAETASASEWIAVIALLGYQLPDGTDIHAAAATAQAWRDVFHWLAYRWEGGVDEELCQAAALLRPVRALSGTTCE